MDKKEIIEKMKRLVLERQILHLKRQHGDYQPMNLIIKIEKELTKLQAQHKKLYFEEGGDK